MRFTAALDTSTKKAKGNFLSAWLIYSLSVKKTTNIHPFIIIIIINIDKIE
jgi:hypothetical protein